MKIIISPAKKMNVENNVISEACTTPIFIKEQQMLMDILREMDSESLQKLWACNDQIAALNIERLAYMPQTQADTPALLAYEGIQYQTMGPAVFTENQWEYVSKHLRILSGFYGCLRPMDGVVPYRLEMQARLKTPAGNNLYQFWGDKIYKALTQDENIILNLASKEYSKVVEKYCMSPVKIVTCIFGERIDGKVKVKATQAKMARGEMVRWMSENAITDLQDIRAFNSFGFCFNSEDSDENTMVFLKK